MTSELRDLYQELILDHSRNPRNSGQLQTVTGEAKGNNPLCGDRVTVYVELEDGKIVDAAFEARGCAISIASASMMTEHLKGLTVEQAQKAHEEFSNHLTKSEPPDLPLESELAALMGVRNFPTRIKCATLPWHTLIAALKGGDEITTE